MTGNMMIENQTVQPQTGMATELPKPYDFAKNGGFDGQKEPLINAFNDNKPAPEPGMAFISTATNPIAVSPKNKDAGSVSFLSQHVDHPSTTGIKQGTDIKMSDATATTVGTMTGDKWDPDVGGDKSDSDAGSGD